MLYFPSYGYYKGLKQQVMSFNLSQGHWKLCHSRGHTWFPINLQL